jgi:two-component system LytT family sensor kinase
MTDGYLMAQTLGFATGSVLSSLLLVLVWKAEKLSAKPQPPATHWGSCAVALVLIWNAGSLVRYATLLIGAESIGLLANACAYSAVFMLPSVGLLLIPWGSERPWQRRISVGLRYVCLVTAAGLMVGLFAAVLRPGFPLRFQTLTQAGAYAFIFYLVVVWMLLRGRVKATRNVRAFAKAMLLIMSALAAGLLLTFRLALGTTTIEVMETFTQQATIPMAIAAFAFLARFRFADVFVKRSLMILAGATAVVAYWTLVVAPVGRVLRAAAPRAEAAAWVGTVILLCMLLLLFPLCKRAINHAADRWLFRRPDYQTLGEAFTREIEAAAGEDDVLALLQRHITEALEATEVRVFARAEFPAAGLDVEPLSGGVIKLGAGTPARLCLGRAEVEALIPVRSGSTVTHLVAIASGNHGRKLLSSELAYLSALGERAGRRLEVLRFELERREQELREASLQRLLTEAELKALRAQINPHFLFNTLNTIADLISSEPERAEAMTERLAEVFRHVLAGAERSLISVAEEFEFIGTYLQIEQARFGDRLLVKMTLDPPIATALIPPLVLQPLVENAIKHGLAPKLDTGTIRISAAGSGDSLSLVVEDDGVGWSRDSYDIDFARAGSTAEGVGLRNVRDRLEALYGKDAELRIASAPGLGTTVRIAIMRRDVDNLDNRRRSPSEIPIAQTSNSP